MCILRALSAAAALWLAALASASSVHVAAQPNRHETSHYRHRLHSALQYRPALPRHLLDRAVSIQGDDARLTSALMRMLKGEGLEAHRH
jgi:hypothetical protein